MCQGQGRQASGRRPRENQEARLLFPSPSNPFCLETAQTHAALALQPAKYYDRCFPAFGRNTCNWPHTVLNSPTVFCFVFLKAHCCFLEKAALLKTSCGLNKEGTNFCKSNEPHRRSFLILRRASLQKIIQSKMPSSEKRDTDSPNSLAEKINLR